MVSMRHNVKRMRALSDDIDNLRNMETLLKVLRELGPFYYMENHGNMGDLLIGEGTRQFFEDPDKPIQFIPVGRNCS